MVSEESQYLVGLVARKDLASAILNADRNIVDSNPDDAQVYFTDGIPNIDDQSRGNFDDFWNRRLRALVKSL